MDHEKVTSGVGVAAAEMRIGICEPTWGMALEYGQTSMGAFSAIQSKQALGERPDKMRIGICEPTWAMVLEYGQTLFGFCGHHCSELLPYARRVFYFPRCSGERCLIPRTSTQTAI